MTIYTGAAHAVVQGLFPFKFSTSLVIVSFSSSLFESGQTTPFGEHMDYKDSPPCGNTVTKSVPSLAQKARKNCR